jgi:hypothetical protein
VLQGAQAVGCQELLLRLTRAGLRRRKDYRPRVAGR